MLVNFIAFLNGTIVPFLLAIAFLVFIWNTVRYFIIGGAEHEKQTEARSLALWSITAFVIIVSMWGIVNLVARGVGLNNQNAITPDYMGSKKGNSNYTDPEGCTIIAADGTCAGAQYIER